MSVFTVNVQGFIGRPEAFRADGLCLPHTMLASIGIGSSHGQDKEMIIFLHDITCLKLFIMHFSRNHGKLGKFLMNKWIQIIALIVFSSATKKQ